MSRLRLVLWPQRYAVARLAAVPQDLNPAGVEGPPLSLVIGHGEVTVLAPEELLEAHRGLIQELAQGWRAITLDAVFPLDTVGVLAIVSCALTEARVPVLVFSSHATDHLLVPELMLGRALAALGQVKLPVGAPSSRPESGQS
jgi:hypothetical protein